MQNGTSETERDAAKAAFALAVKIIGSKAKLARHLGISKPAVVQWVVVPEGRIAAVSALSGLSADTLRGKPPPAPPDVVAPS